MSTDPAPRQIGSRPEDPNPFRSILFLDVPPEDIDGLQPPEIFPDLNLDQIVDAITSGREEYNLKPFFYLPLQNLDDVNYRYEALRDLESPSLAGYIQSFAQEMQKVRALHAQEEKLSYKRQKQSWFLKAVDVYCSVVQSLDRKLMGMTLHSRGFRSFRGFLSSYVESGEFRTMVAGAMKIEDELKSISYSLHIRGKQIAVSRYSDEPDYGADVLRTFEKFSQGAAKEYHFDVRSSPDMNHVEAAVLDLVARLSPRVFSSLEEFAVQYKNYLNATVARFDREVQFYLACLDHVQKFKGTRLEFCHPLVSDRSKEVSATQAFDLALANMLFHARTPIVTNDFSLSGAERILVVSGPNQGGKTTFARTFGQLHYLASIGCPVPGSEARLFLCDRIFTHFEREEDLRNLSGKLEDELLRVRENLSHATARSIFILNESFLSTTLDDALYLSRRIMERILALGVLCISVTFLDELASTSDATVSMVSTVNPRDPALRTFKVVRKPAGGLAYAAAIAAKYHLTRNSVKARIKANHEGRLAP